jgi:beta-glucosidase
LYGGNPFDVSQWIDDVDAVIFAQCPGQEGGAALADLLSGAVSPSGKLPMTWPKTLESVPTFGDFPGVPRDVGGPLLGYQEGTKMGYRHYWAETDKAAARYHFGYGLNYTTFAYSDLKVERSVQAGSEDVVLEVTVAVQNTGSVARAEVVQVYIEDVEASVSRPTKELKGFSKVFLQPREKQTVAVSLLEKYALSFWDEKEHRWLAEAGAKYVPEQSYGWKGL